MSTPTPIEFFRHFLGAELSPIQREIVDAMARGELTTHMDAATFVQNRREIRGVQSFLRVATYGDVLVLMTIAGLFETLREFLRPDCVRCFRRMSDAELKRGVLCDACEEEEHPWF